MDNIGSEIGQKMRCAVKAKLIELGTGYIDDELPDYVMIMVANKRSKQQMIEDLSLFLGSNTQIFVTWLHEVLEKLQEVTLPPQRKSKRRDFEKKRKRDGTPEKNVSSTCIPSITEVIKEGFIQRNKCIQPIKAQTKNISDETGSKIINEFEISEIAKEVAEKHQHEKELQQLAELQRKIYIAKKQLEKMVSDDSDQDVNVDFAYESKREKEHTKVYARNHFNAESSTTTLMKSNTNQNSDNGGQRFVKLSVIRRAEREIYVPAFRRTEEAESRQSNRDRTKREKHIAINRSTSIKDRTLSNRNIKYKNSFHKKNKSRSRSSSPKIKNNSAFKMEKECVTRYRYKNEENKLLRKRIGSRIIVVPERSLSQEVHVGSVIKVKPRILTPENQQASRMLLLRAVSEAQKSTVTSKTNVETGSMKNGLTIEVPNDDEEYVPVPVKKKSKFESKHRSPKLSTQFVVTLDNDCINTVDSTKNSISSSIKDRIGYRMQITEDEDVKQRRKERFEQGYEKSEPVQKCKNQPIILELQNESNMHRQNSPLLQKKTNDDQNSNLWKDNNQNDESHRLCSRARTISPISFNVNSEHETDSCSSYQNDKVAFYENKEAKIKKLKPTGKFDDIPSSLSTVLTNDTLKSRIKERCKFFPNCRDADICDFHHPSAPCNAFPSCKFGDKCAYLHPLCKFDQTCNRPDCQYFHTASMIPVKKNTAPPLASSIFPSQNYKPISLATLPAMCKFFPKCSNTLCQFYHPKPCRFGKQCHNKIECNFYHQELPSVDKLKWISSRM